MAHLPAVSKCFTLTLPDPYRQHSNCAHTQSLSVGRSGLWLACDGGVFSIARELREPREPCLLVCICGMAFALKPCNVWSLGVCNVPGCAARTPDKGAWLWASCSHSLLIVLLARCKQHGVLYWPCLLGVLGGL